MLQAFNSMIYKIEIPKSSKLYSLSLQLYSLDLDLI